MVFDLLWLDGEPLINLPYLERRERLLALELDGDRVRVPLTTSARAPHCSPPAKSRIWRASSPSVSTPAMCQVAVGVSG